jgi:hypothetical protein
MRFQPLRLAAPKIVLSRHSNCGNSSSIPICPKDCPGGRVQGSGPQASIRRPRPAR